MRVALELLDQLLDLVFAICILLFGCTKGYARNSVVNGVVPGFPGGGSCKEMCGAIL